MKKINSKEIILAEVRRYDKELGGLVIEDYKPYALIINKNGKYYNIFNDKEELPLLARVPYNNYTKDGIAYGTKNVEITPLGKRSLCYLKVATLDSVIDSDVSKKDLEEYILNSKYFFRERAVIARERLKKLKEPKRMIKVLRQDRAYYKSLVK